MGLDLRPVMVVVGTVKHDCPIGELLLVRRPVALRYRETTRRRVMNPYYAGKHRSIGPALRNCSLVTLLAVW